MRSFAVRHILGVGREKSFKLGVQIDIQSLTSASASVVDPPPSMIYSKSAAINRPILWSLRVQ